ncbi:MAG: hypothetical protein ACK4HQ_02260 [Brevinematales bacterium]
MGWAYLFAPSGWHVEMVSSVPSHLPLSGLRIYYKPFRIDRILPLFVEKFSSDDEFNALLLHQKRLFPSGVHLQRKSFFPSVSLDGYFFLRFSFDTHSFVLGFSSPDIQALIHLLSGKASFLTERDLLLEELAHWFQATLTRPPFDFETMITSLPDHHIQWLLNWMLSQNIVSVDMLAAYIWSLDEKGKRLIDNLSQSIRQQIIELIATYKRGKTYRWGEEVKYLLHHNLFRHTGFLSSHVTLLKTYAQLRKKQTTENLLFFLSESDHWHSSFVHLPLDIKQRYVSSIPTRSIAAYGSFVSEDLFLSWWQNVLSRRGLDILREDRLWWLTQPVDERAEEAMTFVKQWFTLEAKELVQPEETSTVVSTLSYPWQLELIAYEIGIACCIYALKSLEIPASILPPIMKNLLEDIRTGIISFQGWGDYRILQSQKDFLISVYVLRRLGRL